MAKPLMSSAQVCGSGTSAENEPVELATKVRSARVGVEPVVNGAALNVGVMPVKENEKSRSVVFEKS